MKASEQTQIVEKATYKAIGGDAQRLRGIPVIGPGVSGVSPGTRPG